MREELKNKGFGPFQVHIGDFNLSLKDGTKLSIRFWFPGNVSKFPSQVKWVKYCEQDEQSGRTNEEKFPTVMEYLAYCKSTWTRERDHLRHPWLASHGFVVIRPDMRGTGDSQGNEADAYRKKVNLVGRE